MSEHTPGPWQVSHQDPYDAKAIILDAHAMPKGKRARLIKHIATVEVHGCHINSGEGKANARLIAAAPELLKACKAVAESTLLGDYGIDENLRPARNAALDAIAQAEGGER